MRFRNRVLARERQKVLAVVSGRLIRTVQIAIKKEPSLIPFIVDMTIALKGEEELCRLVHYLMEEENSDLIKKLYGHFINMVPQKKLVKRI